MYMTHLGTSLKIPLPSEPGSCNRRPSRITTSTLSLSCKRRPLDEASANQTNEDGSGKIKTIESTTPNFPVKWLRLHLMSEISFVGLHCVLNDRTSRQIPKAPPTNSLTQSSQSVAAGVRVDCWSPRHKCNGGCSCNPQLSYPITLRMTCIVTPCIIESIYCSLTNKCTFY